MFTRFCTFLEKYGDCRRNTRIDNESVEKIPINIERMEELGIFDDITISIRGNEMTNYLPKQIYSKLQSPNVSASKCYRATINEQNIDPEEFEHKYISLKEILLNYGQDIQIKRLEELHEIFFSKLKEGEKGYK